jgi:hypothetical protein
MRGKILSGAMEEWKGPRRDKEPRRDIEFDDSRDHDRATAGIDRPGRAVASYSER